MSNTVSERFATYATASNSGVVIKQKDFGRLLEEIEELEDALVFEKARKSTTSFRVYREFVTELKKRRRIAGIQS